MLLGQDRCWGQHGHLFARRDGLEDGPNRHFGFAETDISADETIHGLLFFHVPFHIGRGLELIGGGFVGEGFFEFALPGAICREGEAVGLLPFGVELHQVKGNFADRFFGSFLGLGPGDPTHFAQLGRRLAGGAVPAEASELVCCDPQDAVGVLHDEVVAHIT